MKNGWDAAKIKKNKDAIYDEYMIISPKVPKLWSKYETLEAKKVALKYDYYMYYRDWLALKEALYALEYDLSAPFTEGEIGSELTFYFSTNKVFDYVSWYVKSSSDTTELGAVKETDWGDLTSKTANFGYRFLKSGTYIITAAAHIGTSGEPVTAQITVNIKHATVPSPPQSISVSPGWRMGQIDLTWTKSADDGGTPITDYEYQYAFYFQAYRGADAYWDWTPWRSAGTDMMETIMAPRTKTEFRVQMRAVNLVGESVSTNYETVTTR